MIKAKADLVIALQQPIVPDYRMGLFLLLRKKWGNDFQVYAGDEDFGGSPASAIEAWDHFVHIDNRYLVGGRFLWQWGCFRKLLAADVTILNGNMRMLSNTAVLLLRRLLGRRTILWGHAKGQNGFASALRVLYLRLCNGFIAYSESQAQALRERYPFLSTWVAANACVHAEDCVPGRAEIDEVDSILYVGRLVKAKKVRLLLEGFIQAKQTERLPESIRLVFVGDGAERALLESMVDAAGLTKWVEFAGHIGDVAELREYYRRAICSVSPGYVGLSATQSFSFGVPMLVARDEFHSPEIEACQEGFNAEFFESDNVNALASALEEMNQDKVIWLESRKNIADWTKSKYSFQAMADSFQAVLSSSPRP